MIKYSWLLKFPRLYAWLSARTNSVNYEKQLYLRSVRNGDVVFDVGANIGYYSVLFSKLCGRNGFVHCFEPVPETFRFLVDNLANCQNTMTNNFASGEFEKTMQIAYDPRESEKANLIGITGSKSIFRDIKVLPLDNYVREKNLQKLDFLKCDVEGFELKTLKGLKKTLKNFHPQLSIEITLSYDQTIELMEFLKNLGYDSFRKIEKGYPKYIPNHEINLREDYFYLHATSSLVS